MVTLVKRRPYVAAAIIILIGIFFSRMFLVNAAPADPPPKETIILAESDMGCLTKGKPRQLYKSH